MTEIFAITADKEMRRFIKRSLEGSGLHLGGEFTGMKDFLEAYRVNQVPLVVLDLFLPGSSGFEIMKSIKRMDEALLCVLLTRMRTKGIMERAFRFGAQDTLHYPCSEIALRDTILHRLATVSGPEMIHF